MGPDVPAGSMLNRSWCAARMSAIVGAIVVVVLLIVGINGCLDSRKEQAFRNYAGDVRSLVSAEQDLSNRLFETLSKPGRGDALDVQTQVNAQRVDAEQLRRPGKEHSIAGQMQALLASDVIYSQKAIPALTSAFNKRSIDEKFPNVRFMPDLGWLDPDTVQTRLEKLGGGAAQTATPGLHGTSLEGVTVQPTGTGSDQHGVNRRRALGVQLAFDVKVQERRRLRGDRHRRHDRDRGRQEDQRRPDDPEDRGRAVRDRQHPDHRQARQGAVHDGHRRHRRGAGREEHGQQQGHLPGRVHRRLSPKGRSGAGDGLVMLAAVSDDLTSTVGVVALAAGASRSSRSSSCSC